MNLKTRNFHPHLPEISILRLIVGIAGGLSFSYSIYAFLVVCREVIRLLSITDYGDVWILSDAEVHFYNFFYALLALIFGQSLILRIWFFRLRRPFEKRQFLQQSILNDQRNLNAFFIHWFTKISLILGFLYGVIQAYTLKSSSLFPDLNFLFILFAAVLFLQTWTTIRRKYKKGVLRWMAVSAILIVGVSFVFSRINIIDYKKLNEVVLNKNISYVYQIDYPVCEYFNRIERQNLVEDLYLIAPKNRQDESLLIYQDKKYLLSEIYDIATKIYANHSEFNRPYLTYRLHIDRKTPMKYVYELTDHLIECGMFQIGFVIRNHHLEKACVDNVLRIKLPPYNIHMSPDSPIPPETQTTDFSHYTNIIFAKYDNNRTIINGNFVQENELTSYLENAIKKDTNFLFVMCQNDNQPYQNYITVMQSLQIAVNNLREEEAQMKYGQCFDCLEIDNSDKISNKYRFTFINAHDYNLEEYDFCNCF